MTGRQAKDLLLLFRPGSPDSQEPELAEALEFARTDSETARWFADLRAGHEALRVKFKQIPVPEGLREQILSERRAELRNHSRRQTPALALAAALLVLLLGLAAFFLWPRADHNFAKFRDQMVGLVLRQYPPMDLETSDLNQIREFLTKHGAHGDGMVPKALAKATPTGCAILDWKGKTVTMICFNSGRKPAVKDADLYLFIVNRSALTHPPGDRTLEISQVSELATASWSAGGKSYLLGSTEDVREFLPGRGE